MSLWRRDVLKAAGALVAALPIAELAEWPIGRRSREAVAAACPVCTRATSRTWSSSTRACGRWTPRAPRPRRSPSRQAGSSPSATRGRSARWPGPAPSSTISRALTVLPGFYDSHNHMRSTGLDFFAVDLSGTRSVAEVLQAIAARVATTPAGEWIVASSRWHESQLAEARFPTRAELDEVAPNHPVWIPRGGHNRVVNSEAFRRAGITRDTANPPGGTYVRDAGTGELSGHIIGAAAFGRIARLLPRADARPGGRRAPGRGEGLPRGRHHERDRAGAAGGRAGRLPDAVGARRADRAHHRDAPGLPRHDQGRAGPDARRASGAWASRPASATSGCGWAGSSSPPTAGSRRATCGSRSPTPTTRRRRAASPTRARRTCWRCAGWRPSWAGRWASTAWGTRVSTRSSTRTRPSTPAIRCRAGGGR